MLTGSAERHATLARITVAYVYRREPHALTARQAKDVQSLLKNRIPVICETVDLAWHSITGRLLSLSARYPVLHPFYYTTPLERALALWV